MKLDLQKGLSSLSSHHYSTDPGMALKQVEFGSLSGWRRHLNPTQMMGIRVRQS